MKKLFLLTIFLATHINSSQIWRPWEESTAHQTENFPNETVENNLTDLATLARVAQLVEKKPTVNTFYQCDVCGKIFNHKGHFDEHTSTHTDLKPFECDQCQKRFHRKSNLKRHLKEHTHERPYKCTFTNCGKAFLENSTLKNHQSTHTDQQKFACPLCSITFKAKRYIPKHMKLKHPNFTHNNQP